jgi:hypothetical protein
MFDAAIRVDNLDGRPAATPTTAAGGVEHLRDFVGRRGVGHLLA